MSNHHNRSELRFLFLFVICIAGVIWIQPSTDNELSQQECDQLHQLGNQKFLNDFNFDETWDFIKLGCNSDETAFLNALHFLANTSIFLPSSEVKFDFYEWAKRINPIFRKRRILAFSGIANFQNNTIDISTLKLEEGDPVSIANILVHELRHLEEGFNSHVPCSIEPRARCDVRLEENLFDGGPYNYNIAYLYRLIEYGTITRSQKLTAQRLLGDILEKRINVISADRRRQYETVL